APRTTYYALSILSQLSIHVKRQTWLISLRFFVSSPPRLPPYYHAEKIPGCHLKIFRIATVETGCPSGYDKR
ncbi:MAG TPA: hypothetical protein VEC93_16505, partial [Anaerolineae bacterium]|nr:hypothetical protein [Anaerolineae bacterium]